MTSGTWTRWRRLQWATGTGEKLVLTGAYDRQRTEVVVITFDERG